MKSSALPPIILCLALGACASVPPTAPRVTAVAGETVSNRKFAHDDADCRARAQGVTDKEATQGELGLQGHYDSIYSDCMLDRGYHIEAPPRPHYYYGPGPYWGPGPFYGPGPYWGGQASITAAAGATAAAGNTPGSDAVAVGQHFFARGFAPGDSLAVIGAQRAQQRT